MRKKETHDLSSKWIWKRWQRREGISENMIVTEKEAENKKVSKKVYEDKITRREVS